MSQDLSLGETPQDQFKFKLAQLDQMLQKYDPNMGGLLHEMHKQLMSIPELSYILSEEEIGKIVEASKRVMKIEITAASASKRTSVKKDLESMGADDF